MLTRIKQLFRFSLIPERKKYRVSSRSNSYKIFSSNNNILGTPLKLAEKVLIVAETPLNPLGTSHQKSLLVNNVGKKQNLEVVNTFILKRNQENNVKNDLSDKDIISSSLTSIKFK